MKQLPNDVSDLHFFFPFLYRNGILLALQAAPPTTQTRGHATKLATDVRSKASPTDILSKIPTKESKLRFALFFLLLKRAVETPSTAAGGPPPSKMEAKDTVHECHTTRLATAEHSGDLLERYFG